MRTQQLLHILHADVLPPIRSGHIMSHCFQHTRLIRCLTLMRRVHLCPHGLLVVGEAHHGHEVHSRSQFSKQAASRTSDDSQSPMT